jgi:transcriptional accessory protein Tex/SPT6
VEGLIHISELSDERIQHPKSVVQEGEVVPVKILRIEPERRRLGLSLRQARAEAEADEMRGLPLVFGAADESLAARSGGWGAAGMTPGSVESDIGSDEDADSEAADDERNIREKMETDAENPPQGGY